MTMKRKIAAILAADVAGYSRLMANDEEDTLRRLSSYREVFDAFVVQYHGRIFNTAGDSVMCEFDSAVEAVRCAIDIQESLRTRDMSTPDDRKFQYRIGITIGDVVERGTDLLGDGVNIAARLESLAEPGGICVSRSVHEAVANKISVPFHDIGLREVKNIPQPVHAFTVGVPGDPALVQKKPGIKQPVPARRLDTRLVAMGVLAGIAILCLLLAMLYMPRGADIPAAGHMAATAANNIAIAPSPNVIINGVPANTPQTSVTVAGAGGKPAISFTRSNSGWHVTISIAQAVTAIYYRLGNDGDFRRTPTLPTMDPRSGKPMASPTFEMPADQADTVIHIKYDDADGKTHGPFAYDFAAAAAMDTGQKSILEMTSNSWLMFNEDNPAMLYYTHLVAFRCTITAVALGFDGAAPDRPLVLPPCDRKKPNEIPDGVIPITTIPASAQSVTAQLTYTDGSKSEIMTYRRP
jgi:class 3 adenylate cyclase